MALNPNKVLKAYYSVSEVSEMFDVPATTLRFWEMEFPTLRPRKSGRGIRQYSADDVEEVRLIHNLVKVRGMKLAAAREAIAKNRGNENATTDLLERLQAIRAELVDIRRELTSIV